MSRISPVLAALLVALAPIAQAQSSGLADRPALVLDPGMHTAPIMTLDADAAGRFLVTGSYDKTVRVWSSEDRQLLRTIRLPQGAGHIGKAYAVAISPGAELIAVGGWTRWSDADPTDQIYLFDAGLPQGEPPDPKGATLVARLDGLASVVRSLAFSPDGAFLAATLDNGEGMRLFARDKGWAEVAADKGYAGNSVAFSRDGSFATTGQDGLVRLYDASGAFVESVETGGERPYHVAFSPDGTTLAVGHDDRPSVARIDMRTRALLPELDHGGVDNGNLAVVAWSRDGASLYAAGRYIPAVGVDRILAWQAADAAPLRLPATDDTITGLRALPDGDLLVASAAPWLARLGPDGSERWALEPTQMDPRGQYSNLGLSADGMVVDFGFELWGEARARFDLATLTLSAAPPDDGRTAVPLQDGPVTDWRDTARPAMAEVPIALDFLEESHALAIRPDGGGFVLGADWSLRAFDKVGQELWRRPVPGMVGAVNISGDGRLALAAYTDGTLRWHRMEDGVEILAFFPLADRANWVAWTPEGVYVATGGAQGVLRWHVNRGWDEPGEAIPVWKIKETRRPDVIQHVLPQLGLDGALAVAERAKILAAVQRGTRSAVPPGAQLHLLTIGVGDYGEHARHLRLEYADDDALDLLNALLTSQSGLYAKVRPQLLQNTTATSRGILDALLFMRQELKQDDVAVVHFSGHGAMVDGKFYLLPHDVDMRDVAGIKTTALSVDTFRDEIALLAEHGRVIVLLDACRSGATTAGGDRLANEPELLRSLMRGSNYSVLTSSSADENSREDPQWRNGAFTEAVLAALTTRADTDRNGIISMLEMTSHIAEHVPEITGGAQTPGIDARFEGNIFVAGL